MDKLPIYLEITAKRVFAGATDWPGLDRGGKDEAVPWGPSRRRTALQSALGTPARGLRVPNGVQGFEVVERRAGNASTEFGIPALGTQSDSGPVDAPALKRLTAILDAAWCALDAAAEAARGVELRKGPRGGGRELNKILKHVCEAAKGYASQIGGKVDSDRAEDLDHIRGGSPGGVASACGERAVLDWAAARLRPGLPAPTSAVRPGTSCTTPGRSMTAQRRLADLRATRCASPARRPGRDNRRTAGPA